MKIIVWAAVLGLAAGSLAFLLSDDRGQKEWQPAPHMRTVEPEQGRSGDIAVVKGEYLDKKQVAEVYLTNGPDNFRVAILEQKETFVKFKIPADAKPGRLRLMVLTPGAEPMFLEQPVFFTVLPPAT